MSGRFFEFQKKNEFVGILSSLWKYGGRSTHPLSYNRCGRAHEGSTCPGMGLTFYQYGHLGHIRSHCPKRTGRRMGVRVHRDLDRGWR